MCLRGSDPSDVSRGSDLSGMSLHLSSSLAFSLLTISPSPPLLYPSLSLVLPSYPPLSLYLAPTPPPHISRFFYVLPLSLARSLARSAKNKKSVNGVFKYTGMWQSLVLVAKEEGRRGLYAGMGTHVVRVVSAASSSDWLPLRFQFFFVSCVKNIFRAAAIYLFPVY